jgi:hypothetical protein
VARIGRLVGPFWPSPVSGARCRSSVVEHSIGNGEVDSSILSGSTSFPLQTKGFADQPLPVPPRLKRERKSNLPQSVGENTGTLFPHCSSSRDGPPQMRNPAAANGRANRKHILSTDENSNTTGPKQGKTTLGAALRAALARKAVRP